MQCIIFMFMPNHGEPMVTKEDGLVCKGRVVHGRAMDRTVIFSAVRDNIDVCGCTNPRELCNGTAELAVPQLIDLNIDEEDRLVYTDGFE